MTTDRQRFDRLIGKVLAHEGGYVNDPADPGGETKYGISKRSYPKLNIKSLTESQARDIYYADWWLKLRCNELTNDTIAVKLLDMSVNVGRQTGVKLLQRALCDCDQQVAIDGIIGPKTIAAANEADPGRLLEAVKLRQMAYYEACIANNAKLAKFRNGWTRRAAWPEGGAV